MTVVGRETMGVGSVVDTHHEGETKKPTEEKALSKLDGWSPFKRKNPDDFVRERGEREEKERAARLADDVARESRAAQACLSIIEEDK